MLFLWLEFRRPRVGMVPTGKGLVVRGGMRAVGGVVMVAVAGEEADVDGDQEGEDEGLDQADQISMK